MTVSIVDAESRRKQVEHFYSSQTEKAIIVIDKMIGAAAANGRYYTAIYIKGYKDKYQLNSDSIHYIYNCLLKSGFKIEEGSPDIEDDHYWKINWDE